MKALIFLLVTSLSFISNADILRTCESIDTSTEKVIVFLNYSPKLGQALGSLEVIRDGQREKLTLQFVTKDLRNFYADTRESGVATASVEGLIKDVTLFQDFPENNAVLIHNGDLFQIKCENGE